MFSFVPSLLTFKVLADATGTLVTTQDQSGLPFEVKRVFWVYGTPEGTTRGGHAHHTTQEVLSVMRGKVRVETISEAGEEAFTLDSFSQGLYIPPLCWIRVFPSDDAILCCLTSTFFEEADYIRNYEEFQRLLS